MEAIPVTVFWHIFVFVSVFVKEGEEERRGEKGRRKREDGGREAI